MQVIGDAFYKHASPILIVIGDAFFKHASPMLIVIGDVFFKHASPICKTIGDAFLGYAASPMLCYQRRRCSITRISYRFVERRRLLIFARLLQLSSDMHTAFRLCRAPARSHVRRRSLADRPAVEPSATPRGPVRP